MGMAKRNPPIRHVRCDEVVEVHPTDVPNYKENGWKELYRACDACPAPSVILTKVWPVEDMSSLH